MTPTQPPIIALGHPVRLATRSPLIEQAAALERTLQAIWTAAELRANARLIDAYLARNKK